MRAVLVVVASVATNLHWRPDGIALYEALQTKRYDVEFLEIPEGHSWNAWKSHIDDALLGISSPRKGERVPFQLLQPKLRSAASRQARVHLILFHRTK